MKKQNSFRNSLAIPRKGPRVVIVLSCGCGYRKEYSSINDCTSELAVHTESSGHKTEIHGWVSPSSNTQK